MESLITTQFSTNGDISRRLRVFTIIFLSLIFNAILLILINNIYIALSVNESHFEKYPLTVNITPEVKRQINKKEEQRVRATPILSPNPVKIIQPHLILIPNFNQVFELDKRQENTHPTFPQSNNNFESALDRPKGTSSAEFEIYRINDKPVILGSVSLLGYNLCFGINERVLHDDFSIDT